MKDKKILFKSPYPCDERCSVILVEWQKTDKIKEYVTYILTEDEKCYFGNYFSEKNYDLALADFLKRSGLK